MQTTSKAATRGPEALASVPRYPSTRPFLAVPRPVPAPPRSRQPLWRARRLLVQCPSAPELPGSLWPTVAGSGVIFMTAKVAQACRWNLVLGAGYHWRRSYGCCRPGAHSIPSRHPNANLGRTLLTTLCY
ncbi:hypothetical protein Pelo_4433 [Pelomyxa schiedti]|nr:hypothetical protein Pelo_4433 [Pelomyxa schiedti]